MTDKEQKALALLRAAAENGERCPTNKAISAAVGAASVSRAPDLLSSLERQGIIKVDRGHMSRVVTIVETGDKTAGRVKQPHWSENAERAAAASETMTAAKEKDVALLRRVDRDPCPMCGVRGDIGCKHRRVGAPLPYLPMGLAA